MCLRFEHSFQSQAENIINLYDVSNIWHIPLLLRVSDCGRYNVYLMIALHFIIPSIHSFVFLVLGPEGT